MGTYRKEWNCCGSVTETEAWEPEDCPFCTDHAAPIRKDAERYRWLRDLLAVEDIHEALMNRMGVDEAESLKCDAAVDECMAHDARLSGAA